LRQSINYQALSTGWKQAAFNKQVCRITLASAAEGEKLVGRQRLPWPFAVASTWAYIMECLKGGHPPRCDRARAGMRTVELQWTL